MYLQVFMIPYVMQYAYNDNEYIICFKKDFLYMTNESTTYYNMLICTEDIKLALILCIVIQLE